MKQLEIRNFCFTNNLDFIDLWSGFSETETKALLTDDLHPNTQGHELIFTIVKDYLEKIQPLGLNFAI